MVVAVVDLAAEASEVAADSVAEVRVEVGEIFDRSDKIFELNYGFV